jgi:O-antigen ligase
MATWTPAVTGPMIAARRHELAVWLARRGLSNASAQAAALLRVFAFAVFVLPVDTVLRVIGAEGYVANLLAMAMFAIWAITAAVGFHDPTQSRVPVRGALGLFWIASLLSYAVMPLYGPDQTQRLAADRWFMLLAGMSGVILVASRLRMPRDITRVVRAVVWATAFSGLVCVVQFWAQWDPRPILRAALVGFTYQTGYTGFQAREALTRVSGTANHPIEMGVVAGMVLPLAVWLAFYDVKQKRIWRAVPIVLIGLCIPMSVSRSAILTAAVSTGLLLILLPAVKRAWIFGFLPVAAVAVFASTPGYLHTIADSFTSVSTDPSITNRTDNYPRVLALVQAAPWLGRGGGTNIAADATKILDNQYLSSAIELGLFGVLALIMFLFVPVAAALITRSRSDDPRLRALCAALAGACLSAAVGSYTFDSFSFPQFVSVEALLAGLVGACWLSGSQWAAPPAKASL